MRNTESRSPYGTRLFVLLRTQGRRPGL